MTDSMPLDVLKLLAPFNTLSEAHLQDIQRKGRLVILDKGKILFKRGAADGEMHYLIQGTVDLTDASFQITPVEGGSERCQRALDDHNPHAVTAVSTTPVRLFVVPKDHVDLVLTWDQAGNYMVTDLASGADVENDWMSCLLGSAMFAAVPPANIQQLFSKFEETLIDAGEAVIRQGDPGDYFYVVKSGRCKVTRRVAREGETKEVMLAELGPGDMFGEDALIGDAPRNATITMITNGALMRLGKPDFQALLQDPVLDYMDYETLLAMLEKPDEKVAVLDVRLPAEYKRGNVPGSRNLPLQVLRQNMSKLDPETLYVVTCDGGRRSVLAAYILNQEGLEAHVLQDPPNAG
ncbi:MAG: cyclic nucleotide-binding domain-containing protein [Gammaproteobacteria bacterium]|nr:cyclic nucleotide-binding domain-containing protein [Gammaproteobacteria bacterium]